MKIFSGFLCAKFLSLTKITPSHFLSRVFIGLEVISKSLYLCRTADHSKIFFNHRERVDKIQS
ncbi:hypothetical protein LEP1GSC070_4021 [Leptospira santarosai str. AIM]|nr:hypothetical protein LEP1GSC070_4021 [Leptospira santarosai str. AIM]